MSHGNIKLKSDRLKTRMKRKRRIRARVFGQSDRPRFTIFRSHKYIYGQLIDDIKAVTLVSASSLEEEFKGKSSKSLEAAQYVGEQIAKRAKQKGIDKCTFDRNGFLYHGRVKALAEKARESGLKF